MLDKHRRADDLDRNRFYARTAEEAVDGGEYELEAPDAEVEAARERLAKEATADAETRIDIDELLREHEKFDHDEMVRDFFRSGKLRFNTRHLLIATALLAIFLAIVQALESFTLAMFFYLVGGVSAALYYLNRREKQHEAKLAERKRHLRAKFRPNEPPPPSDDSPSHELDAAWRQAMTQGQSFRLSFSLRHLMIGFTVAAVLLGLIVFSGGIGGAALTLGLVAGFGLILYALGVEPPPTVVLGWWLILVLYVVLSIGGMVWSAIVAS